jgi:hypothetical protein
MITSVGEVGEVGEFYTPNLHLTLFDLFLYHLLH